MGSNVDRYWALPIEALLERLSSSAGGLEASAAAERVARFGRNALDEPTRVPAWIRPLFARFASPLVVILVVAALVSLYLREWVDAWIVLGIVLMTVVLGTLQEYRAAGAVAALRRRVTLTARVLRGGRLEVVPVEGIVPGDIVELSAGALVPADGRIIDARDCHVVQAVLTGETLAAEKREGRCDAAATVPERWNCVYLGTSVRSGWARMVVVDTGRATVYGGIAGRLRSAPPETGFERGLRRFGAMLLWLMGVVVALVLAANVVLHRPMVDMLLFAAALAVGMSPELLPAILTITLAQGARAMARRGVIVKRLDAIENLGGMDVLCTDKTGTLTRGVVALDGALGVDGAPSNEVLRLAWLNASLQAGIRNPLDEAVMARSRDEPFARAPAAKLDEIPYDFMRRRLGVVVDDGGAGALLVSKGAVENVLDVCVATGDADAPVALDAAMRAGVLRQFAAWSADGYRVLAVATRRVPRDGPHASTDEQEMVLRGFLLFFDPPEPQAGQTVATLRRLGVDVKVVTGDNRFVARHVADAIGMPVDDAITGGELQRMSDEALWQRAPRIALFTEIDPNQKERIIRALQRNGRVVGYLGDGINDAPALHAADVGISVDRAVDVAKDAADFVLLEHDLDVLRQGISEGRRTFANTLKYVFITTSANFGNMISMALGSLFLPFLPLLAKQILLNNFLSDIPAMGIAGDNVDDEWLERPRQWDLRVILRSVLVFGLTSTIFDLLTFAALLAMAEGQAEAFRTGWFIESLLTELGILWVVRSARPLLRSRPGRFLGWSVAAMVPVAIAIPYSPLAPPFGFVPLPFPVLAAILAITTLYLLASEAAKTVFFGRGGFVAHGR